MNYGNSMIYKNNPQSIYSKIPDPDNINLNKAAFFMVFGLQDLRNSSDHYIDDSIYRVEVIERTKINESISVRTITVDRFYFSKQKKDLNLIYLDLKIFI